VALGGFDCANCHCQAHDTWELRHRDVRVETSTCPAKLVESAYLDLVSLYGFYRDGLLAQSGGVMDQPAFYLSAMQWIDAIVKGREK